MGLPTAVSIVRNFKYNKKEKKTSNQTTLPQVQGFQEEIFLIGVTYTSIVALLQTLYNHVTLYFLF